MACMNPREKYEMRDEYNESKIKLNLIENFNVIIKGVNNEKV